MAAVDIEQGRTSRPRSASVARLAEALQLTGDQGAELAALAAPAVIGQELRPRGPGEARPGLWLEILGPVAASRDGAPLTLGPVRQRALLALLVLHADTGLSRVAIIDALWGGDPPAAAVVMVQGYVTRIRRVLGTADGAGTAGPHAQRSTLSWDGASYWLVPGTVHSDWGEFTELTDRAGQAAAADPAEACRLYEQALQLWRADPLAGIEFLQNHPAVTELNRMRAAIVVDYAAAADVAGLHEPVLGHLRALIAREPLDERANARLMIALAATGQQAAALSLYEKLNVGSVWMTNSGYDRAVNWAMRTCWCCASRSHQPRRRLRRMLVTWIWPPRIGRCRDSYPRRCVISLAGLASCGR